MARNDPNGETARVDPGLAAILAQYTSSPTGPVGATGGLEGLLQQTLLGMSGRRGYTTQKLVGPLPRWVTLNPQLQAAVEARALDPYMPTQEMGTWRVYTGSRKTNQPIAPNSSANVAEAVMKGYGSVDRDTTMSIQQAKNEPFLWNENQVADAIKKFQKAGLKSVVDFDSMAAAWGGLVERAGLSYSLSSGQKKLTPWDVLDLYKNERAKAGTASGGSGGSGGFSGTYSQTQKTINEISQGDAWASLRQTVSNMLGRDPEDQEVRDFAYRMNNLAARNPSIAKTTASYQDGRMVSATTRSNPGFTANDVARGAYDEAQDDPDYAEYQSATTYFNSALAALGAIGNPG